MKFGFAPLVIGLKPDNMEADFENVKEMTILSEKLGFDSVWVFDHLNMAGTFDFGDFTESNLECWTTLTALAMVTEKLRLGTLVMGNPYRLPSVLAKMASTLDVISGGRLDYGIGVGWHEPEFIQYGIPFRTFKERFEMFEEGVEIAKRLWTQKESSFSGKHYTIENARLEPKPIQKPHPPIWVGGMGKRFTLRFIAEHADAWNCSQGFTKTVLKESMDILKGHCKDIGRDFSSIIKSKFIYVVISEDEDEVNSIIEKQRGRFSEEEFRDYHLVGTPEDCTEGIKTYRDIGIEYMMVTFLDTPSSAGMEMFAEKVLPEFKN